jgi:hypothetical protein
LPYLFVPLIVLVVAALAWSWWTARSDRDPASSVDNFNRALTAMRPQDGSPTSRSSRDAVPADESAPDA